MNYKVTLTANAGVIVSWDCGEPTGIAVDALHCEKAGPFSTLNEAQTDTVLKELGQRGVKELLYTHNHKDHYHPGLQKRAEKELQEANVLLSWEAQERKTVEFPGGTVYPVRLIHQKIPDMEGLVNCGLVMMLGGHMVFAPGDADPGSEEMRNLAEEITPDIALLPFVWLTLPRYRDVRMTLNPKYTIACHLPFPEEDDRHYYEATARTAASDQEHIRCLRSFLETTEISL